ncbi:MAG: hypothetical protein KBA86_08510 [Bacteroidales bacterium]|nr:hypothetical protein [Bacteroidales bacterium]
MKKIIIKTCIVLISVIVCFACKKDDEMLQNYFSSEKNQKASGGGGGDTDPIVEGYNYQTCRYTESGTCYLGTECVHVPAVKIKCSSEYQCKPAYDSEKNKIPVPCEGISEDDLFDRDMVELLMPTLIQDWENGILLVSPQEIWENAE